MPLPDPIEQLQRRLIELGCPVKTTLKIVRETAEHHEDLRQGALKQGQSESDATLQADKLLGDPATLAEEHIMVLRSAHWWGRHPRLAFGVLPVLIAPLLWGCIALMGLYLGAAVAGGWNNLMVDKNLLKSPDSDQIIYILGIFVLTLYVGVSLVAMFFIWLIRRSALGIRWTFISCALISIEGLFTTFDVVFDHGRATYSYFFGYSRIPDGLTLGIAVIPLLVASMAYVRHLRVVMKGRQHAFA